MSDLPFSKGAMALRIGGQVEQFLVERQPLLGHEDLHQHRFVAFERFGVAPP
jgi:hypothetical protein